MVWQGTKAWVRAKEGETWSGLVPIRRFSVACEYRVERVKVPNRLKSQSPQVDDLRGNGEVGNYLGGGTTVSAAGMCTMAGDYQLRQPRSCRHGHRGAARNSSGIADPLSEVDTHWRCERDIAQVHIRK